MGLFSKSPKRQSYIGLDIGYSGIKLVELVNEKGRARLVTYAYAALPSADLDSAFQNPDVLAAFVKKDGAKSTVHDASRDCRFANLIGLLLNHQRPGGK